MGVPGAVLRRARGPATRLVGELALPAGALVPEPRSSRVPFVGPPQRRIKFDWGLGRGFIPLQILNGLPSDPKSKPRGADS